MNVLLFVKADSVCDADQLLPLTGEQLGGPPQRCGGDDPELEGESHRRSGLE
jgi:hypothetical protein